MNRPLMAIGLVLVNDRSLSLKPTNADNASSESVHNSPHRQ